MRATSLIFGVIIASLIMGSFGLMLTDLGEEYGVEYDESYIDLYDKLNETETQAYELQTKLEDSEQDTTVFDVIGGFLNTAVESLKLTYRTLESSIGMVGAAQNDLNLPPEFNTAFTTILIIFIILGVVISAMIKVYL